MDPIDSAFDSASKPWFKLAIAFAFALLGAALVFGGVGSTRSPEPTPSGGASAAPGGGARTAEVSGCPFRSHGAHLCD
jgi:hypothetical protein